MQKYTKLLALGDSFSTSTYGLSWPDYTSQKLQCQLLRACSAGAGNAFYIEKLHEGVKDEQVDLVIVQLTEPSRVVVGMRAWEETQQNKRRHHIPGPAHYQDLTHSNIFKDIGTYTLNVHNNRQWLEPMLRRNLDQFDSVWLDQCAGAKFWQYQTLHHMLSMQALCDAHDKRLIFFSWFVDCDELFLPGYEWFKKKLSQSQSLVTSTAKHQGELLGLPMTPCGHYNSDSNQKLFDAWLWPQLEQLL